MSKTSKSNDKASLKKDMSMTLGATDKRPGSPDGPKRPPRIPMNSGSNLSIPESLLDRVNFNYRFFAENNVKGGRIAAAKGAWWEHVADENGNNIVRPSGSDKMYLMKLDIQSFKEDKDLKRKKRDAIMMSEAAIGEGEYAPTPQGHAEGGTTAVTRTF